MIKLDFNVESPSSVKDRLSRGYRGRRNFLIYTLLSMIVEQTPVKTGLARGNWRISIGAPASGTTDRLDLNGDVTVFEEMGKLRGASPFARVFINNNLQYIDDLENGTSTQAPQGILRVVVPAFRSMNADTI